MKRSGKSLFVPILNRDFDFDDAVAFNSLFETRASLPVPSGPFIVKYVKNKMKGNLTKQNEQCKYDKQNKTNEH
jgi:hypothetical protein